MPKFKGQQDHEALTATPSPKEAATANGGIALSPVTSQQKRGQSPPHRWERMQQRQHSNGIAACDKEQRSSKGSKVTGADDPPRTGTPRVDWRSFDARPAAAAEGERELEARKCVFKIFVVFRGGWCMSSHALLRGFAELNSGIKLAGGKVVALSSQTPEQAGRAARGWRLPFQAFGDPSNEIVKEMNRRFGMGCTVSRNDVVTGVYPNGMAQPCVLAVYGDEAQDMGSVLYKWSRWQTIASMRHKDAWAQIIETLSAKVQEGLLVEARGGGGYHAPAPFAMMATSTSRLPPRPSTPYQSDLRAASPSHGADRGGGDPSPFAGHEEVVFTSASPWAATAAAATGGASAATAAAVEAAAAAAAAVEWEAGGGTPRGRRALSVEEAVSGALGVGWMKVGRNPAASQPRRRAAAAGVARTEGAVENMGGRDSGAPRAVRAQVTTHRDCNSSAVATPRGGGGAASGTTGGFPHGRRRIPGCRKEGGEGGCTAVVREEEAPEKQQPERAWRGHPISPGKSPSMPPPARDPPATAASPLAIDEALLPPKHRRSSRHLVTAGDEGSDDACVLSRAGMDGSGEGGGGRGGIGMGEKPSPLRHKNGVGASGLSSLRFWLSPSSGSRRASYDKAVADFNGGGGGGQGKDGSSEESRRTSGRFFLSSPLRSEASGGGAAAAGGSAGGESSVLPPPARRWSVSIKKGARPPSTPRKAAGSAPAATPPSPRAGSGFR